MSYNGAEVFLPEVVSAYKINLLQYKNTNFDSLARHVLIKVLHIHIKDVDSFNHCILGVPQRGWAAPRGGCNTGATREGDKASFLHPSGYKNLGTTCFPKET